MISSTVSTFLAGLGIGFSLILAIGAQNAFVLKQGLKKQHVFITCFICALSDAVLISLGTLGFSHVIAEYTMMITISKYIGALFLFIYGLKSMYSAFTAHNSLDPAKGSDLTGKQTIAMCLAFTWLNPHVYLDTVFLVGSLSTQYSEIMYFTIGAITASWVFFFSLGYGSRILLPVFKKPMAWKVLDFIIAIIMWTIAVSLLVK